MTGIMLFFVLILFVFYSIEAERRIRDGTRVSTQKRYVVYLTKASLSERQYDAWLCGGALVSHDFIITSAACLEDVQYAYVIAGYEKYITDEEIEKDDCTKNMKKKLIYTCTPISYDLKANKLEKWSQIDIGLAKVESPYNFDDPRYIQYCSYAPAPIPINFDKIYQREGNDAMVLGWGHREYWRKPNDTTNYNEKNLNYAPCTIYSKDFCIEDYKDYNNMRNVIKKYMICTNGLGNIADNGTLIVQSDPIAEGCTSARDKVLGFEGVECSKGFDFDDLKMRTNMSEDDQIYDFSSLRNEGWYFRSDENKHAGICQNDHGSPLVTWVGSQEVLIGIASVFKVSVTNKCIGPYLYTSTERNKKFIDCVLGYTDLLPTADQNRRSESSCDSKPSEIGFEMVENHISWKNHPAGLADNEKSLNKNVRNNKKSKNVSIENIYQGGKSRYTTAKSKDYTSKYKPIKKYSTEERYKSVENHQTELKNNKHQTGGKYSAREKHQTDREYTAQKKRQPDVIHKTMQNFQVQADVLFTKENDQMMEVLKNKESHQEDRDIEHSTIKHYQGDKLYLAKDSYQAEVYKSKENINAKKVYPINESDQVDEIYLASEKYHSDKGNPAQESSQEGEIYPAYETYLESEIHLVTKASSTNINHQSNEKLQAEKSLTAQDRLQGNRVYQAQKKHLLRERNLAHTTFSGRENTIHEKYTNKDAARQIDADYDDALLISSK